MSACSNRRGTICPHVQIDGELFVRMCKKDGVLFVRGTHFGVTLKSIFNRVTESRLETHCWNCFIGLLLLVIVMLYLFMSLNNLFLHAKKSPQQNSTKLPTEFQNCPEWKKDRREVSIKNNGRGIVC